MRSYSRYKEGMGGDENQEERIRKNRKEERGKWVSVSNQFLLTFKYPKRKIICSWLSILKKQS